MAATSIGKLNVQIGASADAFNAVLNGASKKLVSFAAQVASPITGVASFAAGLGGISAAAAAISNPVAKLVTALPGGELAATSLGIINLTESTQSAIDRFKTLNVDSSKLGISPEFLRGIQVAAGPAADSIDKMIGKFEKVMGELRMGNKDLTQSVGVGAKLSKFLNVEDLMNSSVEMQIRKIADAYKYINDPIDRATLLTTLFGKSGLEASKLFSQGSEGIDKAIARVRELGLANKDTMSSMLELAKVQKEIKLLRESSQNKAAVGRGVVNELADHAWFEGDWLKWLVGKTALWTGASFKVKANHPSAPEQAETPHDRLAGATQDVIDAMQKERMAIGLTADEIKRLELVSRGATAAQLTSVDMEIAANKAARATSSLNDLSKSLDLQIATFGMAGDQAAIYKAKVEGASDAAQKMAGLKALQLDALRLAEENGGPLDKFRNQFDRINKFAVNDASNQALGRAARQAFGLDALNQPARNPSLVNAGSQEMFRAIDDAMARQETESRKIDPEFIRQVLTQIRDATQKTAQQDKELGAMLRVEGLP